MMVQGLRCGQDPILVEHCCDPAIFYLSMISSENRHPLFRIMLEPIMIFVCGPIRRNRRSIDDFVIETQPAVGEKLLRARCRNTALPRPAMRGAALWSISTMKS